MIIKNEINFLNNHFGTIYDLFDDVVIVDTGSTDGGLELLNDKYGIEVFKGELDENGSLIEARNKSIKLNNSDLILVLDADEIISREDIFKIKSIDLKDDIKGYFLKFTDYRYGEAFEDYKLSLLRNGVYFSGYVHANPQQYLRENGYKAEYLNFAELNHFPNFSLDKTSLYVKQMFHDIKENGGNNRIFWFIGYSYYKLGDIDNSIKFLMNVINNKDDTFPVEKLNSYMVIIYLYYKYEQNINKSIELLKDAKGYLFEKEDDFEVMVNFRLKDKIKEIEDNILGKKEIDIYEFSF